MFELRLLGSPQFILSEQPVVELRAAKSQAIVCYLALNQRPFSRTALCGLFWPDKSDQEARVNLRQAIRLVQKALPGVLDAHRETVALAADFALMVDVAAFERFVFAGDIGSLETAVSLYHGDLLAGFYAEDAYPFEEWLLLERERLRGLVVQALHNLTNHFAARRQTDKGIGYARRLLQLEPWLEEGHRALMRLLAWQGQYSAALKQYATCRKLLAAELGVEPAPETAVLFDRIRQLRTASRPALPQDAFPLIGREVEQAALNQMLHDPNGRLVTLLGPGGVGKTRLMLAVAEQQTHLFLDGVYWVDLAEVETGAGLTTAIISQLGLQLSSATPPQTQLLNYLRGKELLLLLDNFEQLAGDGDAVALVRELLRTAPQLVIMVTSRVRLGLQQEQVYRLDSLPYPTAETPLDEVADYPAARLFAETARWSQPDWDFRGNEATITAVIRICQLVEGLPLGLKMAAALTQAQSSAAIAEAVAHNLDWLSSDMADLPPRQRSLRATFAYSLRLLPTAEQDFFLRLSIFRGGFTREAVQQVVGSVAGKTANPHLLTRLVSHSLLVYDNGRDRYTIHAIVRQFAAEQRRATASTEAELARRYAAYYLTFLAQRQGALQGEAPQMAAAEIGDELDNVRQAWQRGLAQGAFELVLGGLHALSTFFQLNGRSPEAESLFNLAAQQVVPHALENKTVARLLAWLLLEQGRFLIRLSQYRPAIAAVEEAIAWAERSSDEEAEAIAHVLWGEGLWRQGEYTSAAAKLTHALTLAERNEFRMIAGWCHHHFGVIGDIQANYAEALAHLELACAAWNDLSYLQALGGSLNSMGLVAYNQGDLIYAKQSLEEALSICQRLSNRQFEPHLLNNLSMIATEQGMDAKAEQYLQQALQLASMSGDLNLQGKIYLNLGLNARHVQSLESAINYLEHSLQIVELIGDHASIAYIKFSLAEIVEEQGMEAQAEALYLESLARAKQIGSRITECLSLFGLSLLLEQSERERAIEYAVEAISLADLLQHPILMERTGKAKNLFALSDG